MSTDRLKFTAEDAAVIDETLRTGDLNIFASYYMQLPNSGSMWMTDVEIVNVLRGWAAR